MALWNAFDSKLRQLGLVSSSEVGKAMYYDAVRVVADSVDAHSARATPSRRTTSGTGS